MPTVRTSGCSAFPATRRTQLHSTNPLGRRHKAVKRPRRADIVGIFPSQASIVRAVGAALLAANDEWQLRHRYTSVEAMGRGRDSAHRPRITQTTSASRLNHGCLEPERTLQQFEGRCPNTPTHTCSRPDRCCGPGYRAVSAIITPGAPIWPQPLAGLTRHIVKCEWKNWRPDDNRPRFSRGLGCSNGLVPPPWLYFDNPILSCWTMMTIGADRRPAFAGLSRVTSAGDLCVAATARPDKRPTDGEAA